MCKDDNLCYTPKHVMEQSPGSVKHESEKNEKIEKNEKNEKSEKSEKSEINILKSNKHVCVEVEDTGIGIYMWIYVFIYKYIYIYIYTCMYTYILIYIYICIYTFMLCIHTHIHTQICLHTYIYTHIYIIGISVETRHRLFSPYQQAQRMTTGGTGLGLYSLRKRYNISNPYSLTVTS
jgi:hypothetical protein